MIEYPGNYLYRRIVAAKLFIDGYFNENIDLNNIAGQACFSKFHFIRLFKKIYGHTPHQYLIVVRIRESRKLLAEGMPVAVVCMAVGFESLGSFTALFKRMEGIPPAAFQQLQKKAKAEVSRMPLRFVPHCFAAASGWTS